MQCNKIALNKRNSMPQQRSILNMRYARWVHFFIKKDNEHHLFINVVESKTLKTNNLLNKEKKQERTKVANFHRPLSK